MFAALMIRVGSQTLSAVMGGMALFCLYYAAQIPEHNVVWYLFLSALKWGGAATAIVYFQGRYLDQ
jgi:hypothetical protein